MPYIAKQQTCQTTRTPSNSLVQLHHVLLCELERSDRCWFVSDMLVHWLGSQEFITVYICFGFFFWFSGPKHVLQQVHYHPIYGFHSGLHPLKSESPYVAYMANNTRVQQRRSKLGFRAHVPRFFCEFFLGVPRCTLNYLCSLFCWSMHTLTQTYKTNIRNGA